MSERMTQVKMVHIEFYHSAKEACEELGRLVDELDDDGTLGDAEIEQNHGTDVYEAYKRAELAWRNLSTYFNQQP